MLTRRFDHALNYAALIHGGQTRKGTAIPYLSHLLIVAGVVLEYGGTEDEAIAALLHDAVEDAGGKGRLDDIRARFGDRVAEIVDGCSDTDEVPKPEWLPRKKRYIEHLEHVSSSVRLVSAADKLANLRSILKGFQVLGPKLWNRFNGGTSTVWHYRQLANSFNRLGPKDLARDLEREVRELERVSVG